MGVEKKIEYLEGAEKAKFVADLRARYERAIREGNFKGDIREFALQERMQRIKEQPEYKKGGPVKPNGATTISLSDWLESIDPGGWASEEDKPMKVSYKFGTTSQSEEDLISGEIDNWKNLIGKGELDPSTSFMQYLDMILGRSGGNRGGIVSVI